MSWDERKIQILKNEWGKGKTASQIAEMIGGVSRNAVIGKAHRLKLSTNIKSRNNSYNHSARNQISEKKINQIYRVSKSLEFFLTDNPSLELKYKLYAQRRLTARAWRFARNKKISKYYLKYFFLYLLGLFRINIKPQIICNEANKIYKPFLD